VWLLWRNAELAAQVPTRPSSTFHDVEARSGFPVICAVGTLFRAVCLCLDRIGWLGLAS